MQDRARAAVLDRRGVGGPDLPEDLLVADDQGVESGRHLEKMLDGVVSAMDIAVPAESGLGNSGVPGEDAMTIAKVAARSGVHPTSLYRRWGTRDALLLDVAVNRLNAERPIPHTGALHADLLAVAQQVAAGIARPDGLAFLRAVLATGRTADGGSDDRDRET